MFSLSEINESQLDFFKEIENIGASHAATALSTMLGQEIVLRVPQAKFYAFNDICNLMGGPESLVVGTLVEMTEDLNGFILLVQDFDEAKDLSNTVIRAMGMEEPDMGPDQLSELQRSSLLEVTNILSGAYLAAISALTGLTIGASVPNLVIDMAGAVMNLPAATYGEYGDIVLFLETEFVANDRRVAGHFFLTPDVESFYILMKSMGID